MTKTDIVPLFSLHRGSFPLLVSIPHMGTRIPQDIAATMTARAFNTDDCDWHLDQLYSFSRDLGASIITPTYARYVVDLNRPPDDENLYPGQDTTGLVPVDTFEKQPLYLAGCQPTAKEISRRRDIYWRPYHEALVAELDVLNRQHGAVLLWDAHSIRSKVPRLFDGVLPDLNFGTAGGASARAGLAETMVEQVEDFGGYTSVANGRFKGGYITRQYGAPEAGFHALQLELCQSTYMEEQPPYEYDKNRAGTIKPLLEALMKHAVDYVCGNLK